MSEFSQFKSTPSSSPIDVKDAVARQQLQSTQTVTGNPLTLTDAAPINAESLVVEFEPKQDLHGQSAPYVGGAGKNKLPMTVDGIKADNTFETWSGNSYTLNGVTFTILTDNANNVIGIKVNGTASAKSVFSISKVLYLPENTYRISGCPSGGSPSTYRIADTYTGYFADYGYGKSFTSTNGRIDCVIEIGGGYTADNLIFYPMIRLSTETDPTFAPYSNICPITGYTECNVDDVGKNLFDKSNVQNGALDSSGNVYLNPSDTRRVSDYIEIEPNTVYYLSNAIDLANGRTGFWYDENKTAISQITFPSTVQKSGAITSPNNAKYAIICVLSETLDIAQLEEGSTATAYEPYHSSNATIQFGQTIYGGRSNVTDGGTDDEYNDIDLGTFTWYSTSTQTLGDYFYAYISNVKYQGNYQQTVYDALCSQYKTTKRTVEDFVDSCLTFDGTNSAVLQLQIKDSRYSDATAFKTALDGVQLVYLKKDVMQLSTPPTALKLLKGTNHISTDGTTINLGYQPDNVVGELKGEIADVTPISGTATVTLLHEEDQGEDWIVGFEGEINGHFDTDKFDYYLTARYTHAYNTNTQILNMNNCTDGDYVNIWQTGTVFDFGVDGGVTVDISVTTTKLTFTVNCIGDSILGIYSSSEPTGTVKYLITPARKG